MFMFVTFHPEGFHVKCIYTIPSSLSDGRPAFVGNLTRRWSEVRTAVKMRSG